MQQSITIQATTAPQRCPKLTDQPHNAAHAASLPACNSVELASQWLRCLDWCSPASALHASPPIAGAAAMYDRAATRAHREGRSHQFYTELANMHVDSELKTMLSKMANEELKHKEKMEYLYGNTAFPQTSGG